MTPAAQVEQRLCQELGISPEELAGNEIAGRLWNRLVEVERSRRPRKTTQESIDQADEHADENWKKRFDDAIVSVARRKAELTSDDVLAHLEKLADPPSTHNLSAIGAAMLRAMKNGIIESTGRTQRSERIEKHGNRQNVWRSKIHANGGQLCLI